MSVEARAYNLHGLRLTVAGWNQAVEALHGRLARLPQDSVDESSPDLAFEIVASPADEGFARPKQRSRPVYDPPDGEVLYDDDGDLLHIELGAGLRALCEPGRGRARLASLRGEENDLWTLSHPLFTLPFVELLKRRGLYHVHAAGLAWRGRGLVLPGTTGSGKSTLAVALARAGFGFLGDDALFLAKRPGGVRVLAFPDEVDLTDQAVSFFPELAPLAGAPRRNGWRKRQIRAEETYGSEVVWECEPALLVFPRVSGREASKLIPIGEDEALFELAPNVLLTEPASSQAHLDALAELASASRCYRLETGRNLEGTARMLRDLMEGISS